MIAGVFIIAISFLLLVYWLRYSCILILRNAGQRAEMSSNNNGNRFHVTSHVNSVMRRLKTEPELDPLERELERDYHVVTYLLVHAADLELASIENRLLMVNYRMMRLWSRLTRTTAPGQSRRALGEMASVLSVLVGQMGEQSGMQAEA